MALHSGQTLAADRYNVVSCTNHTVHPGEPGTSDDIPIQGVFCAKSAGSIRRSHPTGVAATGLEIGLPPGP